MDTLPVRSVSLVLALAMLAAGCGRKAAEPEAARNIAEPLAPAACALVEQLAPDVSGTTPVVARGAVESAASLHRRMPLAMQQAKLPLIAINPHHRPTDTASRARHAVEALPSAGVGRFPRTEDHERSPANLGL